MYTGNWTIILEADDIDFAVERTIQLFVGAQETVTVTVSELAGFLKRELD